MIEARNIELFKNLAQYNLGNEYYDFHNDFDCIKISLEEKYLTLVFKSITEDFIVTIKFKDVLLLTLNFEFMSKIEPLTIDSLYRGRLEINGELFEFTNNGNSFFYIEFYEGQKIEFFCSSVEVKKW